MEILKKYKKYIILCVAILIMLGISIFIYHRFTNDGMNNKNIYSVKYRVYQNGKWSKYAQNGMTVGDKEHPIQNIQFKYKNEKGKILFDIYDTDNWISFAEGFVNADEVDGIAIKLTNVLKKKYEICYRTYNKKDKWLNWSCDGEMNENKKEAITALEVKIIPKDSNKKEYLKDYVEKLELEEDLQGGQDEEEID